MGLRQRKAYTAVAILLAFCAAQVYVQTGFAEPGGRVSLPLVPQQFIARLTTTGGAATVNGASAASGATILTGATIETPDQVSATIDLGALGTVQLPAGAKIELTFDDSGNVHVKVLKGCVTLKKKGKGEGEITTQEGASHKGSGAFCYLDGKLNPMGSTGGATGGGGGGGGLSTAAKVAIFGGIAGGTVAIIVGTHGSNPSP
jgi:hypothetical protein